MTDLCGSAGKYGSRGRGGLRSPGGPGDTWGRMALEPARLHAITLTGPASTVVQTTEPTGAHLDILRACGLAALPRSITLPPASAAQSAATTAGCG